MLARAQSHHDRFTLHIQATHIQYDVATGTLLFVPGSQPGKSIDALKSNVYKGYAVSAVGAQQGVRSALAEENRIAAFHPVLDRLAPRALALDRSLILHGLKMPQERAERMLNKSPTVLVNVQVRVTGAEAGQGSRDTGFLLAEVERVFVTDRVGDTLATYDVAALPIAAIKASP